MEPEGDGDNKRNLCAWNNPQGLSKATGSFRNQKTSGTIQTSAFLTSIFFLILVLLDTATRVQILDQANCISHSTNTLGKGMNLIILPPAMDK